MLRGIVHGDRERQPAKRDDVARLDLGGQHSHDGHQKQQQQAAAGKHQACRLRRVAHERLQELGHHDQAGEQHDPQNEHHGVGAEEVQILEEAHFDDRVFVKPFPNDERNQSDAGNDGERENEMRPEPVVLLPLVEHDLQGAHAEGEQTHADVVDLYSRARGALHPGRIFDQAIDQKQCQDADRQVDEENPAPGVVVRDPAAQRGPDRRRDDRGDAIEREGQPALLRRKSVRQDRLRHGLQSAAARALQDAKKNDRPQTGRDSAQQGAQREDHETRS